jgi:hypothetical protein
LRTRQLLTRLVIWAMVPILLSACGPSLTGGETEGDTLPKVTASLTYSPAPLDDEASTSTRKHRHLPGAWGVRLSVYGRVRDRLWKH